MSRASTDPRAASAPSRRSEEPRPVRWTRDEFYRMAEVGLLPERHVELIEGEIFVMSPQGVPHRYFVHRVVDVLRASGWREVWFSVQSPLALADGSEPEADIAVIAGRNEDYRTLHPTTALLVVEVSDATLAYDRGRKAALYAHHAIADYWIVNLASSTLEVRRRPGPDPARPGRFAYADLATLRPGDHVAPLAAPEVRLAVADLIG